MTKILLVEDNEMNRDMLSRRLMKKGFEVVMAVDGQEGVSMAVSESPSIILLDMSLPVMSYPTAIAPLVRKTRQRENAPVLRRGKSRLEISSYQTRWD